MTNYNYIVEQCKNDSEDAWNEESVKNCILHLESLSDKELHDLLFEKEVQHLGLACPFYPEYNSQNERRNEIQMILKTAIIKAVPTIKLVEILYRKPNDYVGKDGRERSSDFLCTFENAYNTARDELRKRYLNNVDVKIIENAFVNTNEANKEWLKLQKRKCKLAEKRYQDPYLKRLAEFEDLFTNEDLDDGIIAYDNVISIKGCRRFWDEGGKRLCTIHYILNNLCGVVAQYIGVGDEVVLAVAPYDYDLHSVFDNTPLCDKLYEIIDNEYKRNLVLGCLLIEKFIHLVDSKVRPKVRCYNKDYLVGHFVIEVCNMENLFSEYSFHSIIEKMDPKDKQKIQSFLELAKNLLIPPATMSF